MKPTRDESKLPTKMNPCPNGSTWYGWGHHFRVVAQTIRDGEPAVHCTYTTARGGFVVTVKRLQRYGTLTRGEE